MLSYSNIFHFKIADEIFFIALFVMDLKSNASMILSDKVGIFVFIVKYLNFLAYIEVIDLTSIFLPLF